MGASGVCDSVPPANAEQSLHARTVSSSRYPNLKLIGVDTSRIGKRLKRRGIGSMKKWSLGELYQFVVVREELEMMRVLVPKDPVEEAREGMLIRARTLLTKRRAKQSPAKACKNKGPSAGLMTLSLRRGAR